MKATIYQIKNLKNKDCYIGSSSNYQRRKARHKEDLIKQKHHSIIMQRAYNKYGANAFLWIVLETFEFYKKEELLKREQFYIDCFNPKYNICKIAGSQLGSKRSDEFKEQCRNRMIGAIPWNKGIKTGKQDIKVIEKRRQSLRGHIVSSTTKDKIRKKVSQPIFQLSKDGVFIKEWESAKQASIELKFTYTALIKYLNGGTNKNTFKNFIWKRKKKMK